ncbi:MAG: SPFH domain-containing protein [Clostridia bacterium]|nr:SPFH domain-containing protein [Clostridia bacterium]
MGLIANLKKLFNKNIECGDELDGHFIYPYPNSKRIIHVNSHIIVGDKYCAVFVCNDRVGDVLPPGKHKITAATLPTTFAKLRLDKPNKNGKIPKTFKADVYYVLKETLKQQQFYSSERFVKKSNTFGKVKGYSEGLCDIQVLDPEKLFKVLLIDRYYIKPKQGIELVMNLVGNEVNLVVEKSKHGFSEIVLNPQLLNEEMETDLNEKTDSFGVKISNAEVTSFKLSKKVQKKVAEFIAGRKSIESQFENSGIKYQPEQVVPNKVNINETSGQAQHQAAQHTDSQPQIIRRGGLKLEENANQTYNAKLNTSEVFDGQNQKVCKYCNKTIGDKYVFCPHCGFKQ